MNRTSLEKLRRALRGKGGAKDYRTRRDQVVARRIEHTFEQDLELARVQGLHVFVQNSVATLYGTVRHDLDRELIVSVVKRIPGVKGVVEHLQLVETRFQDGSADAERPASA